MKKPLIALAVLCTLIFSAVAYASGPGAFGSFDDVPVDSTEWYAGAAYSMLAKNIVEGVDGNFLPNDNVNRAQMATMLDRFDDYIKDPRGSEWEEYSNSYYAIAYPTDFTMGEWGPATHSQVDFGDVTGCGSALSGIGDYSWGVSCYSNVTSSVDDLIDEYWDHMERSDNTVEFRQDGISGTLATFVTTSGLYSQVVYLEGEGVIFQIWGASRPFDPAFDMFYKSFQQN